MAIRFPLILLFNAWVWAGFCQINPVRHAQAKFARKHWHEGRAILDKALRKDSLQVSVYLAYSQLFMNPRYPDANTDSAYGYALRTEKLWHRYTVREKERSKKSGIDSVRIVTWRIKIDSIAFEQAKEIGSVAAYQHFLLVYTGSANTLLALELRDEVAFLQALKTNTHESYQTFLNRYPNSHRAAEAKQRFDYHWYTFSTRGNTLHEYKNFVSANPASPYIQEAIQKIFDEETLDGQAASFEKFIREYPQAKTIPLAKVLLMHVMAEADRIKLNDSLQAIYPLQPWLPIHQEHGWGFVDMAGKAMLTGLSDLSDDAACEVLLTVCLILGQVFY
jgi:hypothetical protein